MRLFVAIQLSEEMRESIISVMHDLKQRGVRGNYTPARNLHLTLCFIGETRDAAAVKAALSQVKFKPFKLSLSDPGNFGDLLWIGTRGGQGIHSLAADIRKALDAAGIGYDRQDFKPHITVIRKSVGNWGKFKVPKAEMMVKRVSLMKSENKDGKMVYTELMSF